MHWLWISNHLNCRCKLRKGKYKHKLPTPPISNLQIHLLPSAHSNGCIFPTSSLPCPFSSQLHHTDNINRCLVTQQQNTKAFCRLWIISGPHSRLKPGHIPISSTHMQTSRTDKIWTTYLSDCRKKIPQHFEHDNYVRSRQTKQPCQE